jgi:RimJ/RimL family protein N-acetyltransferase
MPTTRFGKRMITVRQIKEGDIPGFRAALDSVCRERTFLAALAAPSEPRAAEFVRRNIARGYPQFVAEQDGAIVGWCDAIPGDPAAGTAHVGRLGMGLVREFRGQGIGRRLLDATINQARAIGLEKIELSVYASNTPAIALYRKCGFSEEGRKKRGRLMDGAYDDVLLFALMLTEPNQPPDRMPGSSAPGESDGR